MSKLKDLLNKFPLIKHLLYMFLITIVLLWGLSIFLSHYTRQGETVIVPDFTGVLSDELGTFSKGHNLEFEVVDSVFFTGKPKGSVVSQSPPAETRVKVGRKIYLTIVSFQPEKMAMPDFRDMSLRQAKSLIETYGLKLGGFTFVPSKFKDAVLDQHYRGESIEPGTMILKGSEIELLIGDGGKSGKVLVPFLYGKTIDEAKSIINQNILNLGSKIFENCDSSNGFVYKQVPDCGPGTQMNAGDPIDIWFKPATDVDFKTLILEKAQDTIQ